MKSRSIALASACFLTLMAGAAAAATYDCRIDNNHTNGWVAPFYRIVLNPAEHTATATNPWIEEDFGGPVSGEIHANNARRLTVVFVTENVKSRAGRLLDIRYTGSITKSDNSFRLSVRVGRRGQREGANGTCAVVES